MNTYLKIILWIILNILVVITMDIALFKQTTPGMKKARFLEKLRTTELWATIEWMFLIPANRIGNSFLTAPQISLSSYVFNFLGQIGTNKLWLKIPTTPDDYATMSIVLLAMGISKYKLLG